MAGWGRFQPIKLASNQRSSATIPRPDHVERFLFRPVHGELQIIVKSAACIDLLVLVSYLPYPAQS